MKFESRITFDKLVKKHFSIIMVEYTCSICSKTFKQKGHYENHKSRTKSCAPVVVPVSVTKPFLKWVGGKTQIIDTVLDLYPKEFKNYHEPFLGGGSVLLALLSKRQVGQIKITGSIYASDINSRLIGLYKNVQTNVDGLLSALKVVLTEFAGSVGTTVNRKPTSLAEGQSSKESYYYWVRAKFNASAAESVDSAAMFLFLNKTCFRGLYREGPNGFNVPYGHYANPSVFDEDHLRAISLLIKEVIFTCVSFSVALTKPLAGDFVYCDPPYAPENEKSFVSYNSDGFGLDMHNALFSKCLELRGLSVKMLMSNADVKLVKDAFTDYDIKVVSCRRAINSKDPGAVTNEVLIYG